MKAQATKKRTFQFERSTENYKVYTTKINRVRNLVLYLPDGFFPNGLAPNEVDIIIGEQAREEYPVDRESLRFRARRIAETARDLADSLK